jgi:hypothetical protein
MVLRYGTKRMFSEEVFWSPLCPALCRMTLESVSFAGRVYSSAVLKRYLLGNPQTWGRRKGPGLSLSDRRIALLAGNTTCSGAEQLCRRIMQREQTITSYSTCSQSPAICHQGSSLGLALGARGLC